MAAHPGETTAGTSQPQDLARPLAEAPGGGFAGSPDVPASRLCAGFGYSLPAGYRVECETSGLGSTFLGRSLLAGDSARP